MDATWTLIDIQEEDHDHDVDNDDDEEIQHEWGRYHRIKPRNSALRPPSYKISRLNEVFLKSVQEGKNRQNQLKTLEDANAEKQKNIDKMKRKVNKFEDFKNFLAARLADEHGGTAQDWKNGQDGIMHMLEVGLEEQPESSSVVQEIKEEIESSTSDFEKDFSFLTPDELRAELAKMYQVNRQCEERNLMQAAQIKELTKNPVNK